MRAFVAAVPEALRSPNVGEALSGVFGSVSLTAWICLLLPQLIANYKAKSADGLSMKFLFIWLLGDVANLSGALFTSLAPSTIALACYFCVADLILIGQCTYYNTINARRRAAHLEHHHHHHHHHHRRRPSSSSQPDDDNFAASTSSAAPPPPPPPGGASETDPLLPHNDTTTAAAAVNGNGTHQHHHSHHKPHRQHDHLVRRRSSQIDPLTRIITGEDGTGSGAGGSGGSGSAWLYNAGSLLAVWAVGVAGWVVSYEVGALDVGQGNGGGSGGSGIKEGNGEVTQDPMAVVGMVLGYVSAVLYLCARIPQIIKNYREKSCEGLALLFFLLSLTGNFTYGASVISYSQDAGYFVRALPWLLGSLGTMVEDCIIFVQFRIYAPERQTVKPGGTA